MISLLPHAHAPATGRPRYKSVDDWQSGGRTASSPDFVSNTHVSESFRSLLADGIFDSAVNGAAFLEMCADFCGPQWQFRLDSDPDVPHLGTMFVFPSENCRGNDESPVAVRADVFIVGSQSSGVWMFEHLKKSGANEVNQELVHQVMTTTRIAAEEKTEGDTRDRNQETTTAFGATVVPLILERAAELGLHEFLDGVREAVAVGTSSDATINITIPIVPGILQGSSMLAVTSELLRSQGFINLAPFVFPIRSATDRLNVLHGPPAGCCYVLVNLASLEHVDVPTAAAVRIPPRLIPNADNDVACINQSFLLTLERAVLEVANTHILDSHVAGLKNVFTRRAIPWGVKVEPAVIEQNVLEKTDKDMQDDEASLLRLRRTKSHDMLVAADGMLEFHFDGNGANARLHTLRTDHDNRTLEISPTDILMLGEYPFFMSQPTAKMQDVFSRNASRVEGVFGGDCVEIVNIGSSGINGMPGTPVVDMLVVCSNENAPTDNHRTQLRKIGFEEPPFVPPHAERDTWFFGGDDNVAPGHLGRVVLHVVHKSNSWVDEAKAFVGYCNATPAAFEKYARIKKEGAIMAFTSNSQGKLSAYKQRKHSVVLEIMASAKTWSCHGKITES